MPLPSRFQRIHDQLVAFQQSQSYTKPKLRNRLKSQILNSGKNPGRWDARKAQRLAQAYRKAGGGYRGGIAKKQRSLKKWTKERWTTSDGKPAQRNGYTVRYLPQKAWKGLSKGQVRATNRKKIAGSRQGRQFVPNTRSAARAGAKARR